MMQRVCIGLGLAVVLSLGGCTQSVPSGPVATEPLRSSSGSDRMPEAGSAATVRPAAVAGLFYPADQEALSSRIDKLLSAAKTEPLGTLRGLVVPHAGYEYSGPTAAAGYKQVVGRDIRTVVLMAPSHYADFHGAFVTDAGAYETPLGRVPVAAWAHELGQHEPFVSHPQCRVTRPSWSAESPREPPARGEDLPDTWEHSLEVQVPFLQKTLTDFQIVPIVFGESDPQAVAEELTKRLDDQTLLVASSDLSHFYPDKTARELDKDCIDTVCRLDCAWMEDQEACGKQPIVTLMYIARAKGWKAKLLEYRNSGDITGDNSRVVGYAAIAFFEPKDATDAAPASPVSVWTPEDQKTLLALARQSLEDAVRSGRLREPDLADYASRLTAPRACFVTLTKDGALRGCIGHIFPGEPLVKAVVHNAASAAVRDTRFSPVAATRATADCTMCTSATSASWRMQRLLTARAATGRSSNVRASSSARCRSTAASAHPVARRSPEYGPRNAEHAMANIDKKQWLPKYVDSSQRGVK